MKRIFLLALLILPALFSCKKDENEIMINPDNKLIGVWNYKHYQGNTAVYARQKEFTDNTGYNFNLDGTLLERKISGWCATPPVSYSDYPGTWTMLNDSIIQIEDGYWGGTTTYKIEIESVTDDSLRIRSVYEE
jgi:hypothetical protein